MKKKRFLIFMLLILISLVVIILPCFFVPIIGYNSFYYILWPIIWLILAVIVCITIKKKKKILNFNSTYIKQLAMAGSLLYIIIYFASGLIIGFTKSPFNHSLIGIVKNFWLIIVIAIAAELVRSRLFQSGIIKNKKIIYVTVTICLIILDLNLNNIGSIFISFSAFMKFLCKCLIPSIVLNSIISYLTYREGITAALLFKLPYLLVSLFVPIFPSNNYPVLCTIQTLVPLLMYLKIEQMYIIKDLLTIKEKASVLTHIRKLLFLLLFIITITFTMGLMPLSPVVIASNSMLPIIKRGDIVVVEKTLFENIKIDDIIEYKLGSLSVIHRVIKIKTNSKGEILFVTKGDNNRTADSDYVTSKQYKGRIINIVAKIGYPTLWLKELLAGKEKGVGVETGD